MIPNRRTLLNLHLFIFFLLDFIQPSGRAGALAKGNQLIRPGPFSFERHLEKHIGTHLMKSGIRRRFRKDPDFMPL